MRIIRDAECRIECPCCKTLVGLTAEDITMDDTGLAESDYYCSCPFRSCRKTIYIRQDQIPNVILQEIWGRMGEW